MGRGGRKGGGGGGQRRGSGQQSMASELLPAEEGEYYGALEQKHFSEDALGSRFLENSLEDVLEKNREVLSGEGSQEEFLRLGVPPEALLPDRSYYLLRADGEEGMIAADNLPDDEPVYIERAKGDTLSFAVQGERQRTTLATAVVAPYRPDPSRRALITIHPGLPAEPERSSLPADNSFGIGDGDKLTLAELQEAVGRDDLLLQVIK